MNRFKTALPFLIILAITLVIYVYFVFTSGAHRPLRELRQDEMGNYANETER